MNAGSSSLDYFSLSVYKKVKIRAKILEIGNLKYKRIFFTTTKHGRFK